MHVCYEFDCPMKGAAPPRQCPRCNPETITTDHSGHSEFAGMRIVEDPTIPDGEVHVRNAGKLVGKIINVT